jgi:predicted ATPase/DNA-binding winged helix-turn-helix (wHTH) protein
MVAGADSIERDPTRVAGPAAVTPPMVGRTAELQRLVSVVSVPPAVAVVEGEAGIGKTRLVRELANHRRLSDRRFVIGSCRHIRERFPLGAMIDALRGLGRELARSDLSPVTGALRPLLPEIANGLPPAPEPLDDPAAEHHRVVRALIEVLGALGATVLVIENLQWADPQTLDFLAYLVTDLPESLSVVVTFRSEEVEAGVRALTSGLPASVARAHVELVPLDEREAGILAASILGVDRLPDPFARFVAEQTAGLPFVIEEFLEPLRTSEAESWGEGWGRPALEERRAPAAVRGPMLERLSRLDDDARAVAEAAAVLSVPVPLTILADAAGVPSERAERAVQEALEEGVLVEHEQSVGYRHHLAARAVYESVRGARRERLRAQAAAALRTDAATGSDRHHGRPAAPTIGGAGVTGGELGELVVLQVDDLVLDVRTRDVHRGGRPIDLTPTEFRLLELFMRNAHQVLTHELIFDRVWGFEYWPRSNTLRVYVGYLRHKTEAGGNPRLIHTVRGVGYMLRERRELDDRADETF